MSYPKSAVYPTVLTSVRMMIMMMAFSSLARILGECLTIYSPRVLFFFFFVCFKVDISSRTLIPLFMPGQSIVAQPSETTVAECSLTSCV